MSYCFPVSLIDLLPTIQVYAQTDMQNVLCFIIFNYNHAYVKHIVTQGPNQLSMTAWDKNKVHLTVSFYAVPRFSSTRSRMNYAVNYMKLRLNNKNDTTIYYFLPQSAKFHSHRMWCVWTKFWSQQHSKNITTNTAANTMVTNNVLLKSKE